MTDVLCVDDDRGLNDLLRYALTREGWTVRTAETGREAVHMARTVPTDVVILDLKLPDIDGFEVLSALRAFSRLPVIMLTARSHEEDALTGFRQGADDYVTKPFSTEVLVHRIKAILRRASGPGDRSAGYSSHRTYSIGGAIFDPEANAIVGQDMHIALTPVESRILHVLLMYEGQTLEAKRIVELVQGMASASQASAVKTHIRHLRAKISRLPGTVDTIQTERGAGYRAHQTGPDGLPPVHTDAARAARQERSA